MKYKLNIAIATIFTAILLTVSANAATITVNTLVDENNTNAASCSLREAINNANGDNATNGSGCVAGSGTDSIVFSVNGTIDLTAVLPDINSSMNIGNNTTTAPIITVNRSSGGNYRIFFVGNSVTAVFNGLIVTNGRADVEGGGIYSNGNVTINNCVLRDNVSDFQAGGIQNNGTMIINTSTISGNRSIGFGGGLLSFGNLTINNSTITNNETIGDYGGGMNLGGAGSVVTITNTNISNNRGATGGGGIVTGDTAAVTLINSTVAFNSQSNAGVQIGAGIQVDSPNLRLVNTIVAQNFRFGGTPLDITLSSGTIDIANSFNNLIGTGGGGSLTNGVNGNQVGVANTGLLPMGNYGGLVQTMPIRTNSLARNAGTNAAAPATDARGYSRAQGSSVDIGAFEIQTNSVVTNIANTGAGSLRNVAAAVPANEIVQFENPLFYASPQTISLSAGQITIGKNLTIYGNGANLLTVRNTQAASATSRVFNISNGFNVNLTGITVSGGNLNGSNDADGSGAGIYSLGNTTLQSVVVTGNIGNYRAGGIYAQGTITILNSTISNNTGNDSSAGGGIYTLNAVGVITNSTVSGNTTPNSNSNRGVGGISALGAANNTLITNCTITDNNSGPGGFTDGVSNGNGVTIIRNSIVAGNRNSNTRRDVGSVTSGGYNLIGNVDTNTTFNQPGDQVGTSGNALNPLLTQLGNFGGSVPTHSFTSQSSPAIDKGNSSGQTTDARGLPRIYDSPNKTNTSDGADIGAVELQTTTAAGVSIGGRVLTNNGRGLTNAIVTLTTADGETRTARTGFNGRFSFADVANGVTYILSVKSKRYSFEAQALNISEDNDNIVFVAR